MGYLAYIEYIPTGQSTWPKCMCLNHPVLLTDNFSQADDFLSSINIRCSNEHCGYCSAMGIHKKVIREINTNSKSLHIIFWMNKSKILGNWKLKPINVPKGHDGFGYTQILNVNTPTFINSWRHG